MLRTQTPLRMNRNPMMHFNISVKETSINTVTTGSVVHLASINAVGTETAHAKQLSNTNVTAVLPPDLIIK